MKPFLNFLYLEKLIVINLLYCHTYHRHHPPNPLPVVVVGGLRRRRLRPNTGISPA